MSDSTAKTVVRELGGFSLLRELGEGGMGKVFLARQESLDRKVALKVLLPELAKDEEFRTRFLREARAAALFSHSNIVSVVDAGVDESIGVHYIAFEYVAGGSLEDLLAKHPRLEEDRVLDLARGVLAGLSFAESKGIIHRDIKPDNVLVTRSGNPKLADLGLAKNPGSMESQVTQTGVVLGTPLYMSPEQALGEDVLDIRTDLYAWGLCMWRMLTGLIPFNEEGSSSSLQILTKHINEDLVDARERNPALSAEVAEFVLGLTARDRDKRYPTAASALADLERLLAGEDLASPAESAGAPAATPLTRASARLSRARADAARSAPPSAVSPGLLAGVLIGALGIGVGLALRSAPPAQPETSVAQAPASETPLDAAPDLRPGQPTLASTDSAEAEDLGEASQTSPPLPTPTATPAPPNPKTTAVQPDPIRPDPSATPPPPPRPAPTPALLATSASATESFSEKAPRLLERVFAGKIPAALALVAVERGKAAPATHADFDHLSLALRSLQTYVAAREGEGRTAASAALLELPPARGPLGKIVNKVVRRLQRFVHLSTTLRAFSQDLSPDRVLNFQGRLLADQSPGVLRDYGALVSAEPLGSRSLQRSRQLRRHVALADDEVGHLAQAWALMTLVERINTWRLSFEEVRAQTNSKDAPLRFFDKEARPELLRSMSSTPRFGLLLRAWGVLQTGSKKPSLFHASLRDVWDPALEVTKRLLKRPDDSVGAVLLELSDLHVDGAFVRLRLQPFSPRESKEAPEGAIGLVASGDLGDEALEAYFSHVSRKLSLKRGAGNLSSVRVNSPAGGILSMAIEPGRSALWISQEGDHDSYRWSRKKGAKTWKPGLAFKVLSAPDGLRVRWVLGGQDPLDSLAHEQALLAELLSRAPKREPERADDWPRRGQRWLDRRNKRPRGPFGR